MIKNFLDSDDDTAGGTSVVPVDGPEPRDDPAELDPFAASDANLTRMVSAVEPPVAAYDRPPEIPAASAADERTISYTPPTAEQSARMNGLAFTAGIAFVSSVGFMLVLGWLADILLGTAPWGIVGGIVLGSIIGFIQFFRLNSQILGAGKPSTPVSLLDIGEPAGGDAKDSAPGDNHTSSF